MARRRNPFGPRRRQQTNSSAPPAPVTVKLAVLDPAGLANAYEWLALDEILGLKLALEWYTTNATTLMYKAALTPADQKTLEMASKLHTRANLMMQQWAADTTATNKNEIATAARTAIERYEKIWGASKNLPLINTPAVPGKNVTIIQTVLGNLNAAYGTFGVVFRLTMDLTRDVTRNEILLPQSDVAAQAAAAPIKAVLDEALTVAKAISIVTKDGETKMDGALFMSSLPLVLNAASAWALTADRLTKPVGKLSSVKTARAPRTPRVNGAPAAPRPPKVDLLKVITVVDLSRVKLKGKRGAAIASMKTGMTIADLKASMRVSFPGNDPHFAVAQALAAGAITLN